MHQTLGNFQLQGEIARGAMGVVYRGLDPALDRPVAIKVLLTQEATTEDLSRFRVEAMATARMRHPNIVGILSAGAKNGKPYLVMDLIEGRSLKDHIKERGRYDELEAARLTEKLARALHYAHSLGVLHRDVKPANVLIDARGEPQLTDFGLAKVLDRDTKITMTGEVQGTPVYMPPEQATGEREKIGPASDVYSLGATLYELLTGEPVFTGQTVMSVLTDVITTPPTPPSQIVQRIQHPKLEALCLRALAKEPSERFASAEAFADALREVVLGAEMEETRPGAAAAARPLAPAPTSTTKGRAVGFAGGLALGGALAAGLGWSLVSTRSELASLGADHDRLEALVRDAEAKAAAEQVEVARLNEEAQALVASGDYVKALPGLWRLAALAPTSAKARALKGRAHAALGERELAEPDLQAAEELAPGDAEVLELCALGRVALGQAAAATKALEALERLEALPAPGPDLLRARVSLASFEPLAAAQACERALAVDSESAEPYLLKAEALLSMDPADPRGVEALSMAIEKGLNSNDNRLGWAEALIRSLQGKPQQLEERVPEIEEALEAAKAIPRTAQKARCLEAFLRISRDVGQAEAVLADVQRLSLGASSAPVLARTGWLRLQGQDVEGGLLDLERAIAADPSDPLPRAVRGAYYFQRGVEEKGNPNDNEHRNRAFADFGVAFNAGWRVTTFLEAYAKLAHKKGSSFWDVAERCARLAMDAGSQARDVKFWRGVALGRGHAEDGPERAQARALLESWLDAERAAGRESRSKNKDIRSLFPDLVPTD